MARKIPGLGGLGGLGDMLKQAQKAAQDMQNMEEELADEVVEASSGGGMVAVRFTGTGQVQAIRIDPSVVDPDDVEMLEDLVLAAVREGLEKANELRTERLQGIAGGMNLPKMPGMLGG